MSRSTPWTWGRARCRPLGLRDSKAQRQVDGCPDGGDDVVRGAGGSLARLRSALPSSLNRAGRADRAPKVTFTREDARRLNERFALLDRHERRAIVRAVNRGEAMTKKRDAELAVGVARRQQRFWTRAWLLGPAIAVIQVLATPIGWMEGLLLGLWGAVLLGMMAAWWWTRARRAEMLNLAMLGPRGSRAPTGTGSSTAARAPRSRLPGGPPRAATTEDGPIVDGASGDSPEGAGGTPRPPRPRGRKRR
jgi:hypothetical protein